MKIRRYHVIITLLAVYALFMTFYFGLELLRTGEQLRFYVTLIAETAVIICAYFALRKRDKNRRKYNDKNSKG